MGPDVKVDHGPLAVRQVMVIGQRVVDRHGAERQRCRLDFEIGEDAEPLLHPVAGDGEDADLQLPDVVGRERLVVPLDLVDGEGNLLHRLELDDVGNLLRLHRRQLGEPGKRRVARNRNDQVLALQNVGADELPEAQPRDLVLIDVRCGQDLLMRNHREIRDADAVAVALEANRLDGGGADFHSPG